MKVVTEEEEEEEEEEEAEDKKTLVVGVKLDTQSRELLTWSLVNLAHAGDRVIALHVLLSSNDGPGFDAKAPSLLSLMKDFDAMLAVYKGFCNLKQIDLKLKICRGGSIRKALVQEAQCFGAASLIVGIAKNSRTIGTSSTSIAKYCARKLACDCSVLAVSNGKIIFQRAALEMKKTVKHDEKGNWHKRTDSECSFVSKTESEINSNALYWSSHGSEFDGMSQTSCGTIEADDNFSVCSPDSLSKEMVSSMPEARPRWKLVQKAVFDDKITSSKFRPKSSMIRWAMRLSNRYSISSMVYSDQKHIKSKTDSDNENRSLVSAETDSSHSSDTIEHGTCELPKELESLREKYSSVCRVFDHMELMQITSNFSQEKLIGKGGSSRVYKGCLSDGKELAVKILKPSLDALRAFVSEIEIITALNHKNIISLFGFCFENNNLILVYDFLSRGCLEEVLHGEKEKSDALSWVNRYRVAVGVAEALDYLHNGGGAKPVIHRDVKSSNILLYNDFEPKLADFGLAKGALSSTSHITCSDVAGTFGYLAPEYFIYGKVDEKIDVYAFGVVLLELLSGRKPIRTGCPKGEESLVLWAKPILNNGKVKQLVDPCLGDEYDNEQMERMVLAATLCTRQAPPCRPQIGTVLKLLQGDDDIVKWARSEVKTSEDLDGVDNEEICRDSDIKSHLSLALLDVDDGLLSISSTERASLDEYLQGRCSRSSSFD
ncbi:hypothetical protein J5N97_020041 [Dioscorea zingiberensis]|uniref:Protein kinase domain-containing protein n=1 Tax=Dioscorea zingiberensis TaxID=325984 RepID=A0A9D5CEZ4_9LILI|nr:hypothetical protein J5N97_020041 [Dioscorea zingiberensis]